MTRLIQANALYFCWVLVNASIAFGAAITGADTSFAQSSTDDLSASSKSKYLNGSVYRIRIAHNYYFWDKPTEIITATAVLVRAPNFLLTTRLVDSEGVGVYETYQRFADGEERRDRYTVNVCEEEPDRVRMEKELRDLEKELKDDSAELEKPNPKDPKKDDVRFQHFQFSNKDAEDKAKAKKDSYRKEQKEKIQSNFNSAKNLFSEKCARFKVKKIDVSRNLVLLEATDPLNGGIPQFNSNNPYLGAPVTAYGFPVSAEGLETRRSTADERTRARLVPTLLNSSVSKVNTDDNRKIDEGQVILHQAPMSMGTWGGPLVNECGDVVGLNMQPKQQVRIVTLSGPTAITGKNRGEVGVGTIDVAGTDVHSTIGSRELSTFAQLNGFDLKLVSGVCDPRTTGLFGLRQSNIWVLFGTAAALLLATAAMVVAMRRPGPVRDTVARVFPGMTRRQDDVAIEGGYGGGYQSSLPPGGGTHYGQFSSPPAQLETLPTTPPAAAGRQRADASSNGEVGAKLVPVKGGQTIILDAHSLRHGGVVFGREEDSDVLSTNSTVSKQHARFSLTANGKLQIDDLGSANGTWRGRHRIQREAFSNGEVVRFGSEEYRIEIVAAAGDAAGDTVFLTPAGHWLLSGFDEQGHVVQWQLQPSVGPNGRPLETTWVVGRSADRADKLLSDKSVSGEHARLRFTPQRGLEICDLGSANGTIVDGRTVKDSYLSIDDARVIEFGAVKLTLSKA